MFSKDFFSEDEFKNCKPSCMKEQMNQDFLKRLNKARKIADVPFVLNSAYRSSEWDKSKSRSGTGYHTKGRAVDIKCLDSSMRAVIVNSLLFAGFNGIGISKTFIHVDDRPNKILWLYE